MVGVALDMADKELLVYFMSIDKCKFRRMVVPGDRLEMRLTTVRGKPGGKVLEVQRRGRRLMARWPVRPSLPR